MNRSTLLPFIIFAAASLSCKEPPAESPPAVQTTEPAILFLGDSLTAGFGLLSSQSMPALIEEKIRLAGLKYRVINGGRSGDTSAGGLERLPFYLRPEVGASVFVIGLGSNDAMRGLSPNSLEKNLREIVRRIRAYEPDARIFLFEMKTFPNMGPLYSRTYERVFHRVAEAERIHLIPFPLRSVAAVPKLNQRDGIHPNEEGTQIFADHVWRGLKEHL